MASPLRQLANWPNPSLGLTFSAMAPSLLRTKHLLARWRTGIPLASEKLEARSGG